MQFSYSVTSTGGDIFALLPTTTLSVGVGMDVWVRQFSMFVCLFVCPQHNSKTKDPKVLKLGIGNELGIS